MLNQDRLDFYLYHSILNTIRTRYYICWFLKYLFSNYSANNRLSSGKFNFLSIDGFDYQMTSSIKIIIVITKIGEWVIAISKNYI